MINLAGDKECDHHIERELRVARIPMKRVPLDTTHREVPYTIEGELGPFTFYRAWYYWVAKGPMPLMNAQELYADPAGRRDVRVAGHCGCPPPQEWAVWRDQAGKKVIHMKEKAELERLVADGTFKPEFLEQYHFDEWPERHQGFIEDYHIDSEVGLRLYADMIRRLFPNLPTPREAPVVSAHG